MFEQKIVILRAANGEPTAVYLRNNGRELLLHSRYDPTTEAKEMLASIPVKEHTLHVILGLGLGYHVRELLKIIPGSSKILVIESTSESFRPVTQKILAKEKWLTDKRYWYYSFDHPDGIVMYAASTFFKHKFSHIHLYEHIPSVNTNAPFYKRIVELFRRDFTTHFDRAIAQVYTSLESNIANHWCNLPCSWRNSSIARFEGKWADKPVVIVSAGPSLSEQLAELKKFKNKALIICVLTAAKILVNNGVIPDFVIAVDPFAATERYCDGWDSGNVPLLYYQQIWRGILAKHRGPKFWFTMSDENPLPFVPDNHRGDFKPGFTVAFSALQFAQYIKANPIIFMGQDFAFPDGHTHVSGAAYDTTVDGRNDLFYVPSNDGKQVLTDAMFHAFLLTMQDYIKFNPQFRYINTSRRGALIRGMELMTPQQALELCAVSKFIPVPRPSPAVISPKVIKHLTKWRNELADYVTAVSSLNFSLADAIVRFKQLDVYQLNHIAYDDFFHAVKLRTQRDDGLQAENVDRLCAHCSTLADSFTAILRELEM